MPRSKRTSAQNAAGNMQGTISKKVDAVTQENLSQAHSQANASMQNVSGVTTPVMTEKDILADCLRTEILLAQSYNSACIESADKNVFDNLKNILNEEHDIHYEIFNIMNQKGWYPVTQANMQDINSTRNMYQS